LPAQVVGDLDDHITALVADSLHQPANGENGQDDA
jgi:hypothetical protein